MKVFLISERTLKENSILPDNLNGQAIQAAINEAQNIWLAEIIGSRLLDRLCGLVETGDIELPDNKKYKTLIDNNITNFLIYRTLADIQLNIWLKDRNAGVVKTSDSFMAQTSFDEVNKIEDHFKNKAQFFAQRLTDFLCRHKADYPEYDCCGCDGLGGHRAFYIPTTL